MGLRRYIRRDPNFVNTLSTIASHKMRSEQLEDEKATNVLRRENLQLEKKKLQSDMSDVERANKMQKHMFIGQTLNPILETIRSNPEKAPSMYKQAREILTDVFGDVEEMPEVYNPDTVKHLAATNNIFYDALNKNKPLAVTFTNKKTGLETKASAYSPRYQRLSDNPDWDQGEVIKTDKIGGGTEGERTWLRETGGKISKSQYERENKIKEIKAKQDAGYISPEDRMEYQQYAGQQREVNRKIRELKSDPLLAIGGDNKLVKQRRQELTDLQAEAKELKTLMDLVVSPRKKAVGTKKLDDATAREYWEKAGGDIEKARQMALDDGYTLK